jgi:hypothetical protein
LINALPGIVNLLIICFSLLTIFAIVGVNIFKGLFYYCDMSNIPESLQTKVNDYWDCLDYGGEWVNSRYNFDNILQGLMTQFAIMCTEGWLTIYQTALNSPTSHYQMPKENNNPAAILYFVISIVVSSLFILNMFVGVVISTFNIEKEKLSHNTHLTKLE